jgi:hypothetical protein
MSSHGIVNIHVCIIPCHGIDEICIHTMDFDVMSIDMPCGDICVILVWAKWDDMLWQTTIWNMSMWQFHRSLQAQIEAMNHVVLGSSKAC